MEHVERYMQLYPNDKVVIKGGAAANLIIKSCLGMIIPMNDIDISINTTESCRTIVERWLSILPGHYVVNYDNYLPTIFNLTGAADNDISFDIFVNEDNFEFTEKIGPFLVENLNLMTANLNRDLIGRKADIDLMRSGAIGWTEKQISDYIVKYNRMLNRLELLTRCVRIRNANSH